MTCYIAVDVGGTQIRAACYPDDSSTPAVVERIPTRIAGEDALERIISLIRYVWPENGEVQGVGVAAPGPLDPYQGIIFNAPNIEGWIDFPLQARLEEALGARVAIGNDANLAALGESSYGAGQGHSHLIYITVSTGVGGGIIVGDQLLLGHQGLAAEIGHVTVMPDGPMCGCGHRGHLEALASGPSIARWFEEQLERGAQSSLSIQPRPITAKMIGQAAKKGDPLSIEAITRAGEYLGLALTGLAHIFNPTVIIIGGGVSRTGSLLLEPLRKTMEREILSPQYMQVLTITTAALGDDAGLAGALALAHTLNR
jgi:glucokinase